MQPEWKSTRLLHWLAMLMICGWAAGCDGRQETIYSPPAFAPGNDAHPPAVRIIMPANGATFHAHADIRLMALATPQGTDLGPEENEAVKRFADPDKYFLRQSPEDGVSVKFLAGTNSLGSQSSGMVSAGIKPKPGQATPMFMVVVGYPAVEIIWKDVPAGSYTLTADATNAKGLATVSTPVNITVLP
jgi:hypothetical protein